MLDPTGPEYALADDLHPLLEFTRTLVTHEHRKRIHKVAPSATIAWCDPKRALSQVADNEETTNLQATSEWNVTGLARFQEYGLRFYLAGEPAFWYASDDLTPEEVICHTLSLTTDSRRVGYSMLLIEQEEITQNDLMETAAWYGLESIVEQMYRLINGDHDTTEEMSRPMPSGQEYADLKKQYGVV
ncbi:hypothetical protein [Halocatena halophila]|uniref:hypothetical protein n=1 Tax=Halocatena halophila TaxID=2814576 RepID=UPI002ED62377